MIWRMVSNHVIIAKSVKMLCQWQQPWIYQKVTQISLSVQTIWWTTEPSLRAFATGVTSGVKVCSSPASWSRWVRANSTEPNTAPGSEPSLPRVSVSNMNYLSAAHSCQRREFNKPWNVYLEMEHWSVFEQACGKQTTCSCSRVLLMMCGWWRCYMLEVLEGCYAREKETPSQWGFYDSLWLHCLLLSHINWPWRLIEWPILCLATHRCPLHT